jgi:hypothetical protein
MIGKYRKLFIGKLKVGQGGNNMNWEEMREYVQPAIQSKVEEFHIYGLNRANEDEVWDCLRKKKWKRLEEPRPLRDTVNDILSLSTTVYMSFVTVEAYKQPFVFPSYPS